MHYEGYSVDEKQFGYRYHQAVAFAAHIAKEHQANKTVYFRSRVPGQPGHWLNQPVHTAKAF